MKTVLKNLVVFIALTLGISALMSCTGTKPVTESNTAAVPAASATPTSETDTTYPPMSAQLAQAQFELMDGTNTTLADRKGKVVLATIWGTWCGPCREEIPTLIKLQDQYRDKGLEVMGLNIGDGSGNPEPIDSIKAFIEKNNLNYTVAISPVQSTIAFQSISRQQVVPQTILVTRDGRLRGVWVGGGQQIARSIIANVDKVVSEGS